eukprot:6449989-Ditylum_brightwellii.AAC.1
MIPAQNIMKYLELKLIEKGSTKKEHSSNFLISCGSQQMLVIKLNQGSIHIQEVKRICTLSMSPWSSKNANREGMNLSNTTMFWLSSQISITNVLASGMAYQEVKPEIAGRWKPGSIFVLSTINELFDVKGKLEEGLLG